MKWGFLAFIVGIIDLWVTSLLYETLGAIKLVELYIATTLVGILFLAFRLSELKKAMASVKSFKKKQKGAKKDIQHWGQFKPILKPMTFCIIYIASSVLIAVPGIFTDVLGILLILPVTTNWLIRKAEAV